MTTPIPFLRRYGPAVILALLIPALSLLPARLFRNLAGPHPPTGLDKIVHAALYAALTGALCHALSPTGRRHVFPVFSVVTAAAAYGVLMEGCQSLTRSRSPDPFDALANLTGALAAALLVYAVARRHDTGPGDGNP